MALHTFEESGAVMITSFDFANKDIKKWKFRLLNINLSKAKRLDKKIKS